MPAGIDLDENLIAMHQLGCRGKMQLGIDGKKLIDESTTSISDCVVFHVGTQTIAFIYIMHHRIELGRHIHLGLEATIKKAPTNALCS